MAHVAGPAPAGPSPEAAAVMFILRSAIANLDRLGPAALQAIAQKLNVANPLLPDKKGYIQGTFLMLLADFGAGWFTVNNVTTNRLQALALALGLNAPDDRLQVFTALQAFAAANQNLIGVPLPPVPILEPVPEEPIVVPLSPTTPATPATPATPTTPAPSSPQQPKPKYKVFSWGGHRTQAIAMPTEPGQGKARIVTKKGVSSPQHGPPSPPHPPVGRQEIEQLNAEYAANLITREQYDAEFAKLMGDIRARKTAEQFGAGPNSPARGAPPDAAVAAAPRFVRTGAPANSGPVVHPAFGPDVTEPPPFDYTPGHIALTQDYPDPCPYLSRGSTQPPPGPRLNEHPPQPFQEPPSYGQPGVPEMPPPPAPRMMDYTAPPLKSGQTFSPPEGETATKYTYDFAANRWYKRLIRIRLDRYPFQEGTMRHVFFMKDLSQPEGPAQIHVAKISKDANEPLESYFKDCEMQALAAYYAEEFSQFGVPKHVQYVEAAVIECHDRQPTRPGGRVLFSVEPLVVGPFLKYTNNYGWVNHELPRHTPQAFAHFTWCYSQGTILVADVQGVIDNMGVDRYTDPQVLSTSGPSFGRADMQLEGVRKFFETHQCNDVCRKLGLPKGMAFPKPYVPPPRRPLLSPEVVDAELAKPVAAGPPAGQPPASHAPSLPSHTPSHAPSLPSHALSLPSHAPSHAPSLPSHTLSHAPSLPSHAPSHTPSHTLGLPGLPGAVPHYRQVPYPQPPAPAPPPTPQPVPHPQPVHTAAHNSRSIPTPIASTPLFRPTTPTATAHAPTPALPTYPTVPSVSASYIVQGSNNPPTSTSMSSHSHSHGHSQGRHYAPLQQPAAPGGYPTVPGVPHGAGAAVAPGLRRYSGGSHASFGGAVPLRYPGHATPFYPGPPR